MYLFAISDGKISEYIINKVHILQKYSIFVS